MKIDLWLQCYPGQWTVTQTNTGIWYCQLFFVIETEIIGKETLKVVGQGDSRLNAVKNAILQYCEVNNDVPPLLLEA